MSPRAAVAGALLASCVLMGGPGVRADAGQVSPPPALPASLTEALDSLERRLSPPQLAFIRDSAGEDMGAFHMTLGLTLRNRWGLWAGSRLAQYFNSVGIYHPDDMSGIILTSLWRRLHGRPIDLARQVREAQAYWRYALRPESTSFPACPGGVHLMAATLSFDTRPYVTTHIGQCPATRKWWMNNADVGWLPADSSRFRDLLDLEDVVP
jgi:hypothetical protein